MTETGDLTLFGRSGKTSLRRIARLRHEDYWSFTMEKARSECQLVGLV